MLRRNCIRKECRRSVEQYYIFLLIMSLIAVPPSGTTASPPPPPPLKAPFLYRARGFFGALVSLNMLVAGKLSALSTQSWRMWEDAVVCCTIVFRVIERMSFLHRDSDHEWTCACCAESYDRTNAHIHNHTCIVTHV